MTSVAAPLPLRLARLVRLEHTVFALPFAYVGALLAVDGWPGLEAMAWITVAMVGARTLAMGLNRLVDAELDARNPRTATRELPAGALTRLHVAALCVLALAVYLVAVFQLDPLVRWLWPIPVVLFVVYPYLKRATWLCHLWLGASLGLAPVGGWVALTGELPWQAWALGGAVGLWVAGFDLFYSLFDREHDLAAGLHSWGTRFGSAASSSAPPPCTPARSSCSGRPVSGSTSGSGTGSAWAWWPRSSPTSTRSFGRATSDGSTPRSSPSTACFRSRSSRSSRSTRCPERSGRTHSPDSRTEIVIDEGGTASFGRRGRPTRARGEARWHPRAVVRPRPRRTSGTDLANHTGRLTFLDTVTSGHRGCPWGWLAALERVQPTVVRRAGWCTGE